MSTYNTASAALDHFGGSSPPSPGTASRNLHLSAMNDHSEQTSSQPQVIAPCMIDNNNNSNNNVNSTLNSLSLDQASIEKITQAINNYNPNGGSQQVVQTFDGQGMPAIIVVIQPPGQNNAANNNNNQQVNNMNNNHGGTIVQQIANNNNNNMQSSINNSNHPQVPNAVSSTNNNMQAAPNIINNNNIMQPMQNNFVSNNTNNQHVLTPHVLNPATSTTSMMNAPLQTSSKNNSIPNFMDVNPALLSNDGILPRNGGSFLDCAGSGSDTNNNYVTQDALSRVHSGNNMLDAASTSIGGGGTTILGTNTASTLPRPQSSEQFMKTSYGGTMTELPEQMIQRQGSAMSNLGGTLLNKGSVGNFMDPTWQQNNNIVNQQNAVFQQQNTILNQSSNKGSFPNFADVKTATLGDGGGQNNHAEPLVLNPMLLGNNNNTVQVVNQTPVDEMSPRNDSHKTLEPALSGFWATMTNGSGNNLSSRDQSFRDQQSFHPFLNNLHTVQSTESIFSVLGKYQAEQQTAMLNRNQSMSHNNSYLNVAGASSTSKSGDEGGMQQVIQISNNLVPTANVGSVIIPAAHNDDKNLSPEQQIINAQSLMLLQDGLRRNDNSFNNDLPDSHKINKNDHEMGNKTSPGRNTNSTSFHHDPFNTSKMMGTNRSSDNTSSTVVKNMGNNQYQNNLPAGSVPAYQFNDRNSNNPHDPRFSGFQGVAFENNAYTAVMPGAPFINNNGNHSFVKTDYNTSFLHEPSSSSMQFPQAGVVPGLQPPSNNNYFVSDAASHVNNINNDNINNIANGRGYNQTSFQRDGDKLGGSGKLDNLYLSNSNTPNDFTSNKNKKHGRGGRGNKNKRKQSSINDEADTIVRLMNGEGNKNKNSFPSAGNSREKPKQHRGVEYKHGLVPRSVNLQREATKKDDVEKTTIRITNIPNCYKQKDMMAELNAVGFQDAYDFFYLPIDQNTDASVGYCFVNFIDAATAQRAVEKFRHYRFMQFRNWSAKIGKADFAFIQGYVNNYRHYEKSAVNEAKNPEHRPLMFPQVFERGERNRLQKRHQ